MMENYQETCTSNNQTEQTIVLRQVETAEKVDFGSVIDKEENYNFGAEVPKTITPKQEIDVNDENTEDKAKTTNVESVTSTKTETVTESKQSHEIFAPELPCAAGSTLSSLDSGIGSEQCEYGTTDDIGDNAEKDEVQETNDVQRTQQYVENQENHIGPTSVDSSDDDTSTSTDSDFSDISGLSDVSGKEWKPVARKPILWVQKQIHSGRNPRELLSRFLPAGAQSIALGLNDMSLWRLLANMLSEPPRRQKLRHVNTFEDVIQLILRSENIVVLTGAGVSVSCGIPDFRSSDGIYSRLAKDYPNLPDPQAMFDIDYFSRDPRPFYKFAREIYPGQFKPSPCHRFIKLLEEKQRLLRNYTQNIDTLEQVAGIKRVIECHGSFSTASCTKCKFKCNADAIRADIFAQRIPACPRCQPHVQQSVDAAEPVSEYDLRLLVANGIMKPDIVFFGEGLPEEFHKVMASDKDKCDLLIVIGSSLKVRPVALIPSSIPANVPQILINREQLNHLEFDVELLGDSDVIINQICHQLGDNWKQICFDEQILQESKELKPFDEDTEDDIPDGAEVDNDEETCQILDIDTQSVKSNTSAELGFRAVGSCSDSGFESSTSMGQPECVIKSNTESISNYEIENIKTSILGFNDSVSNCKVENDIDFHPFSVRPGHETEMTPPTTYGEGVRHLSIDSTKDSGIQCDSSNSMAITGVTSGAESDAPFNEIASSSSTAPRGVKTQAATSNLVNPKRRYKSTASSAAEFLVDGTYYYHRNSCSYIFPGAQISWYADTDSELDEDEATEDCGTHCPSTDDNAIDDLDNKCDEGNCSQDSHEYTEKYAQTIKNQSISTNNGETTANSTTVSVSRVSTCSKRRSSSDRFYKSVEEVNVKKTFALPINHERACSETPPLKKRRTNDEVEAATPANAIHTTTINTNTNTNTKDENRLHTGCGEVNNQNLNTIPAENISVTATTVPTTAVATLATSMTITTKTEALQDI